MPSYANLARAHWQQWLPTRYAALPDPDRFFDDLGRQAEQQVVELWEQLKANDQAPAGEDYLARVGRLNALKLQAEEIVLRDLVYLDPEPGADDPEPGHDPDDPDERPLPAGNPAQERWIEATLDALIDERITPADLSPEELHLLQTNLPPRALELAGLPTTGSQEDNPST
jgi:hypothetical protein